MNFCGDGRDLGLAPISLTKGSRSFFGMESTSVSRSGRGSSPLNTSQIKHPKPHMSSDHGCPRLIAPFFSGGWYLVGVGSRTTSVASSVARVSSSSPPSFHSPEPSTATDDRQMLLCVIWESTKNPIAFAIWCKPQLMASMFRSPSRCSSSGVTASVTIWICFSVSCESMNRMNDGCRSVFIRRMAFRAASSWSAECLATSKMKIETADPSALDLPGWCSQSEHSPSRRGVASGSAGAYGSALPPAPSIEVIRENMTPPAAAVG
mmetsp:Transcript_10070/g.25878  ORF Transcript_10070/g.25878 Transcript_10070/m.25878 type:complete len:264 (-) Transcript_10070:36-827(-)